jgi:hypothetical protein
MAKPEDPQGLLEPTGVDRRGHNDRSRPLTWKEALRQIAAKIWETRWETYTRQVPVYKRIPAYYDIIETRS